MPWPDVTVTPSPQCERRRPLLRSTDAGVRERPADREGAHRAGHPPPGQPDRVVGAGLGRVPGGAGSPAGLPARDKGPDGRPPCPQRLHEPVHRHLQRERGPDQQHQVLRRLHGPAGRRHQLPGLPSTLGPCPHAGGGLGAAGGSAAAVGAGAAMGPGPPALPGPGARPPSGPRSRSSSKYPVTQEGSPAPPVTGGPCTDVTCGETFP